MSKRRAQLSLPAAGDRVVPGIGWRGRRVATDGHGASGGGAEQAPKGLPSRQLDPRCGWVLATGAGHRCWPRDDRLPGRHFMPFFGNRGINRMRLGEHGQQRKLCDVQFFFCASACVRVPNVLIFHTKKHVSASCVVLAVSSVSPEVPEVPGVPGVPEVPGISRSVLSTPRRVFPGVFFYVGNPRPKKRRFRMDRSPHPYRASPVDPSLPTPNHTAYP